MFKIKIMKIYFLMILFFLGINLLKNIYIEKEIKSQLREKGLKELQSLSCEGLFTITCLLEKVVFEQKSIDTIYTIESETAKIMDLNFLKKNDFINNLHVSVKKMKISDSRDAFFTLKRPINLELKLTSDTNFTYINLNFFQQDLKILINTVSNKIENLTYNKLFFLDIEVDKKNDVIKNFIYELYKVKLLELIENDDEEFSSTRGVNIPLGIDTKEVIAQNVFLDQAYESVSILLLSELGTLKFIMDYEEDNKILNFLRDVINNNGKNKLHLQIEKKDK